MSVVPSLVSVLRADPAISAIIGDRVYVAAAPEIAERPLAVLVPSTEEDGYHMRGSNKYPETQFQVICLADDMPTADLMGDAIIEALEDYSGVSEGRGLTIFREPINSYDHVPAQRLHRRIVGFKVRHRAAA